MKSLYLSAAMAVAFGLLCTSRISAQFSDPQLLIAERLATAWYDVDLDGDLDMLDYTNGIWTEQGPNGEFYLQHIISTDNLQLLNDADNDGDIDVLGKALDGTTCWYENQNTSSMWPKHVIGFWDGYNQLFDVNMDGQNDIVNFSFTDEYFVHYALGGGDYADGVLVPYDNPGGFYYDNNSNGTLYNDLDGDGFIDIVTNFCSDAPGGCLNGLYHRYQFSSQGYTEITTSIMMETVPIMTGDIDSDGDFEPITYDFSTNSIYAVYDAANGDILTQTHIADLDGIYETLRLADLNGDGYQDVIGGQYFAADEIYVWFGTGGGQFLPSQSLFGDFILSGLGALFLLEDIDGDGDIDISVGNYIMTNDGLGTFAISPNLSPIYSYSQLFVNFDLDAAAEFVAFPNSVFHFNGDGQVVDEVPLNVNFQIGPNYVHTHIDDFNNDGCIDYAVFDGPIIHFLACGPNTPTEYPDADISSSTSGSLADIIQIENALDMNEDGNLDVIYRSLDTPSNLAIIMIDQNFNVEVVIDFPLAAPITSLPLFQDMDMDGDIDMIFWEDNVNYLNNDGTGHFTLVPIPLDLAGITTTGIVDLNGDGIGDSFDGIGFLEFDGYGGSIYHPMSGFVLAPYENFVFMDLNDDELPEIIVYNLVPDNFLEPVSNFHVYRNENNFQFTEWYSGTINNGMMLQSPRAADIDGDGIKDIVWAIYYQDFFKGYGWCRNDLNGYHSISGHVFVDENNDGDWSEGETGIDQTMVYIEQTGNSQFVSDFFHFVVNSGYYTVSVNYDTDIWYLTTPDVYSVNLDGASPTAYDLKFGFRPVNEIGVADAMVTAGNAVCEGIQMYTIQVHTISEGYNDVLVTATFDPLLTYLYSSMGEYSINGNEIQWLLPSQPYGMNTAIQVYVQYPGTETIGDLLTTNVSACLLDPSSQSVSCDNEVWTEYQSCAYDPNDKQVSPAGISEQGLISNGTELTYTVRFQNTGNAPAQTVVIEDQLSENLDMSTMQIIAWSHNMHTEIDENRNMTFTFPDIMLPDSLSDPVGSQGFVTYSISPNADLPSGTVIENTAEIYFDLNPPIITNTTLNTILVCGDPIDGGDLQMPCGSADVMIDPGLEMEGDYSWTINEQLVSTDSILNIPANGLTNFVVTLQVDMPGCVTTIEYQVNIPAPLENVDIVQIDWFTLSTAEMTGYTYAWYRDGELIVGETGSTLTAFGEADFTVVVTSPDGCTGSFTGHYVLSGVTETNAVSFVAFPSPVREDLRIKSNITMKEIRLFHITGELLVSKTCNSTTAIISMEQYSSGEYLLQIIATDGTVEMKRVTKM